MQNWGETRVGFGATIAPSDDWLNPSLNVDAANDGYHNDEFLSALEAFPIEDGFIGDLSPIGDLGDVEELFQRPQSSRATAMRTAFSMNDLQTLQIYEAAEDHGSAAYTSWNPRLVSRGHARKPSLASVPEGGLPEISSQQAVNLMPMAPAPQFQQPQFQQPQFQQPRQHATAFGYPISRQAAPSQGISLQTMSVQQHQKPINQQMYAQQPQQMFNHQQSQFAHQAPMMMPTNGYTQVIGQPLHSFNMATPMSSEFPERNMTDIKTESGGHGSCGGGWDTDSSGGGASKEQPFRLQPSGATLRKSQSALELGAWKKIAAGDLDFVDPSGSVREQLQGLEYLQQIGRLTPEERLQKILRYRAKRQMRNFNKTVKYQCRKSLADTRPRVRGRFARDNEPGSVMPHETKKAMREKTTTSPTAGSREQQGSPQSQEEPNQLVRAGSASPVLLKLEPVEHTSLGSETMPGQMQHQQEKDRGASQPTSVLEQHASLAHLYNMWSDAGSVVTGSSQQQQQHCMNLQGTSSNSA